METDVVIVGAGILGLTLAYHLAKQKRKVVILEREPSYAHHASGKNSGMIRQLYRHPQLTSWANRSIRDWPQIARERAFEETGSIILGREVPCHHNSLFSQTLTKTVRNKTVHDTSAVVTETDGILDPCLYADTIYKLTNKSLAKFFFRTEVSSIEFANQNWTVHAKKNGLSIRAPWVVNAAGAWASKLFNSHRSLVLEANPFARHLFVLSGWKEHYMPIANVGFYWDEELMWYMRKWDKQCRLVSICDKTFATPDNFVPNPHIYEQLARRLIAALPEISNQLKLGRCWHCFRMYTEDQLPVWGETTSMPGLFWLTAFGGFGMSTSFAASEDAAKYICGTSVTVTPEFLPGRVLTHD